MFVCILSRKPRKNVSDDDEDEDPSWRQGMPLDGKRSNTCVTPKRKFAEETDEEVKRLRWSDEGLTAADGRYIYHIASADRCTAVALCQL